MSAHILCYLECDRPGCSNESQRGTEAPFHGTVDGFIDDTREMGLWEPRPWLHVVAHDLDLCGRHWPAGWTQELVAWVNGKQVAR